jgi:hypothetical protein
VLESLLAELAPHADSYHVARILAPLAPPDADYRHIAFWARLRYFCRIYLESSRWIRRLKMPRRSPNSTYLPRQRWPAIPIRQRPCSTASVPFARWWRLARGDQHPVAGCAAALTLAAICCVLYSVSASPFNR